MRSVRRFSGLGFLVLTLSAACLSSGLASGQDSKAESTVPFETQTTTAYTLPAQTLTTLHSFDGRDGDGPNGLVQATDGNLYGTSSGGGANGYGTIFKITPGGTLTTTHSFDFTDGSGPSALVQGTDGNFYGTTSWGGANSCVIEGTDYGCGTIFKITPSGTLTTLYSFDGTDGLEPFALVQATDGNLYGTTFWGGANDNTLCQISPYYGSVGCGTVFKITPGGALTTLYNFCSKINCADGANPFAGLVQATDGNFYGTTQSGGTAGSGSVFKTTPSGTLTTLGSFDGTDGWGPNGLVQATDGNFYGTTLSGGLPPFPGGTVFKITASGTLTMLYSFCPQSGCTDGWHPAGLVQATDGNFYGMTGSGGANCEVGCGTVFRITPSGTLTTSYSFCSQSGCTDGANPTGLVQDTNGKFYGTTFDGGASSACSGGCGTIFSLSVGLGPFVETQPTSGKVDAAVEILGTDLTGATTVGFDGKAADFKVVSSSLITTKVPAGATTGKVKVVTPSLLLLSNVNFRVLATSSTSLASSLNPSPFGAAVTFAATVTSAGGTPPGRVTFEDGSSTLGTVTLSSGKATFQTSALSAGTHSITAVYGGSTNFAGSTSSVLTQTVKKATSSTSVVSSLNPSTYGASVTFTATVTSSGGTATGTVTFKDGSSTLGAGTLSSGRATFKTSALTVASYSITAVYGGSADFGGSTSPLLTQTVNKASCFTSLASSLNPSRPLQLVTFTATVTSSGGSPTGTVTFKDGSSTLGTGTLSGGKASFTTAALRVGTHSITAVYGGSNSFNGSTSPVLKQVVNQ
jgi:uncharacterized repeat protein (TIGR03803 family)